MAELKRTLGFWLTSAFAFLNLVNTGIFLGIALGVQVAGANSILVWAVLALMSIYTAMCFSELTTMFPSAGGIYEFAKQAYGRFISFEIGWVIWLINNIATALLVVAALEYLLPGSGDLTIFGIVVSATMVKLVCAVSIILIMNYIAYRGADESAKLMLILAIFTVVMFFLILIPGSMKLQMSQFTLLHFEWPLLLVAAFLVSETFFGWETVSFMAEEIVEPHKTIPKALNYTAIFVALSSLGIALVTMGVLGFDTLASGVDRPILELFNMMGFSEWVILIVNVGVVVTFLGNAAGGVIGNPRLLMALSRDKLFIEQFSDIHPKHQTPFKGIILQTVVAILLVWLASGAYQRLLELVVAPSITLYALIIFLVPWFRWTKKDKERPYKAIFGSWLPLVLVLFYLVILVAWTMVDPTTLSLSLFGNADAVSQIRLLLGFIIFSIPIYLVLTFFYDPDALIDTLDKFAMLNLWFENIIVPISMRKEILEYLPDAKGKHILEFGSGVGSVTMHLADHVGPSGKVYALDFSKQNVRILNNRLGRLNHNHVKVVHDPHLVNRVHPDVGRVDMIVSVANLSYIQDVPKVLGEMNKLLRHSGKICFIEYIDFFWFLPNNPKWLSSPEAIKAMFSQAGFAVHVRIKKGFFWKYLYIYGIKHKGGGAYI